ncbi:GNAT family N-acetyltransferase [Rossellomorea marisflavi]|uniref:GNAT family N-acetyltransferase n=1 Tax=Rossellomorea marisflavi TaxID=189381 RepID=UPI0011E8319A|nr:GNAT family N-acetyltransferase [Rossellomorea marisflavi]TYO68624.1 GNAT family N-acetyltransferase [Rossellomorea marisflavi]
MIQIERATLQHVEGISDVCSRGYRATYGESHPESYIERIIEEFYHPDRISSEITDGGDGWDGWYVALEDGTVLGAIGGGMTGAYQGEVFVLYLDPDRRGEGIGTLLLEALTRIQREKGATEQWVSVARGNQKGIPFYEARALSFSMSRRATRMGRMKRLCRTGTVVGSEQA